MHLRQLVLVILAIATVSAYGSSKKLYNGPDIFLGSVEITVQEAGKKIRQEKKIAKSIKNRVITRVSDLGNEIAFTPLEFYLEMQSIGSNVLEMFSPYTENPLEETLDVFYTAESVLQGTLNGATDIFKGVIFLKPAKLFQGGKDILYHSVGGAVMLAKNLIDVPKSIIVYPFQKIFSSRKKKRETKYTRLNGRRSAIVMVSNQFGSGMKLLDNGVEYISQMIIMRNLRKKYRRIYTLNTTYNDDGDFDDIKTIIEDEVKKGVHIDLYVISHGSGGWSSAAGWIGSQKVKEIADAAQNREGWGFAYSTSCWGAELNSDWIENGAQGSIGHVGFNSSWTSFLPSLSRNLTSGITLEEAGKESMMSTAIMERINPINIAISGTYRNMFGEGFFDQSGSKIEMGRQPRKPGK